MKGLKVQCPNCKKVYHETTEMFDPDVRPNGAMVRLLEPWKGWGWAAFDAEGQAVSTTLCSEMLCPGCTAPLTPSGRLTVITDEPLLTDSPEHKEAPIQEAAGLSEQTDVEVTQPEELTVKVIKDDSGLITIGSADPLPDSLTDDILIIDPKNMTTKPKSPVAKQKKRATELKKRVKQKRK